MGLESATYINDLVATNPTGSDLKSAGDDQIRLNKSTSKNTFPGFTGAVMVGGVFSGTASAHVLTPATALPSYTAQTFFTYTPTAVNTGACTVNVSGLGAKSIKTVDGADPTAGDIPANKSLLLQYDGTNMILMSGGSYVPKTGNSTITGNITLVGNLVQTGDHSVSGTLSGPSMTAKGNVSGEVWSGTHDFTSSTVTVPTPSAAAHAVTKSYADGLAFATALPAQAGNAGKFVTTNGTTASWASLGGGALETTSAVDMTLTSSSVQTQAVNMTASGKSVTLPDATTLTAGTAVFVIVVTGYPVSIRNSAGTLLTTGASGQTITMALLNNGTAAGTWAASASVTAGGTISTGTYGVGSAVAISGGGHLAMLTPTTGILVACDATNLIAYVLSVDGSGVKFGVAYTIAALASTNHIKVTAISSTKAIVSYVDGSPALAFVCLTAGDNATPTSRTITAGAILSPAVYANHAFGAIKVTSTQILIAHFNNANWVSYVINESAGTLTKGSTNTLAAGAFGHNSAISAMTSTKFLISSTNTELVAVIADVSGSTVTSGTKYQLSATNYGIFKSAPIGISATRGLIIASNTSTNVTDIWSITVSSQTISTPVMTSFGAYTTGHCYASKLTESKYMLVQDYSSVTFRARGCVIDISPTIAVAGNGQDITTLVSSAASFGISTIDENSVVFGSRGTSNYASAAVLEIGAAL